MRNHGIISYSNWIGANNIYPCNRIAKIPLFPDNLQSIDFRQSTIKKLPPLPAGLRELWCSYSRIDQLPDFLPTGLQWLYCRNTKIAQLPPLPTGLRHLDCSNSNIIYLPEIPGGLEGLYCRNTNITQLPPLPASLLDVDCRNTWIKHPSNPKLKKKLRILAKIQRKIKNKLYLRRLSKQNLLKKIFPPEITGLILSY